MNDDVMFKIPKLKQRRGIRGDKRRYRCGSCRKVVWTTRLIAVTRCRACRRGTMRPHWQQP